MVTRIGINGFGRVGRAFTRYALQRSDLEVMAVNDITDAATLAHLLEYDSTYGRLHRTVGHNAGAITIDGRDIPVLATRDPARRGAKKVLISAPGKGVDATIVMGVNDESYDPVHVEVISNASCTTNCVAPMAKVLHDAFGIERGFMTTIHAYTSDQQLLDAPHKDLPRARSAAVSIIPTSTGAAKATGEVIPALKGRLDGVAVRVPVEDGSLTDLAVVLATEVTADEVNDAFRRAATGRLAGVLHYSADPLVSRDIIGNKASCVFDSQLTAASRNLVKVFGWYDNE
jgi:glyceraldehyde 3-phosphate dehydrogenase